MSILARSLKGLSAVLCAFGTAAVLSLMTGCGLQSTISPSSASSLPTVVSLENFKGGVMGGQQPIYNAVIGLYAAGTTGYGAGASSLLTGSPVTTSAAGSFSITSTITCPTATSQVYITATGGDPTGAASNSINNTAIKLVAALGPCSGISSSTSVQINEVTTVAAAFALGQFYGGFGGTDVIGAPLTNQNGLINAFATAHNLASTTTGVVTGTTAAGGTNYYMIAADEQKLNTIANIISDCVNQSTSGAGPCNTLFSDVTPTYAPRSTSVTATAPTDVFQAAVYMSLNPTSANSSSSATNLAALMVLQTPFMPFAPALSGTPSDWTLALQYTGTGISYLSSAAVDANGDLWFSNANTTGGAVQLNGGTANVGGTYGVTGGVINFYTGNGTQVANSTRQVAIDKEGNAWYGGYTTDYLFRTTGSATSPTTYGYAITGSTLPYAIGIDGNDVVTATTANGNLQTIAATATSGTPTTTSSVISGSSAASLAITSGTSSPTAYAPTKGGSNVFEFTTGITPVALNGTTGSSDGETANYGAAIDGNNKVWIVNESASGVLVTGSGSSFTAVATGGCLATPQMVAIDGNNNVWTTNGTTTGTTAQYVCEFNNSGTLLSNSTGFGPHNMYTGRGIAIDLSGNVWVTSYALGATYSYVTEIVGAAVPVVAPLSVALANGKVGTRP